MPEIQIAPEVRDAIGDEQARRYSTEPNLRRGQCWDCNSEVDADAEPAAVVILRPERFTAPVDLQTLTHTRCRPSQIRILSEDEIAANRASRLGDPDPGNAADVYAEPFMLPGPGDTMRPILLVAFRELVVLSEGGERIDPFMQHMLGDGWAMATRLGRPPQPAPGWSLHFTMIDGGSQAPGSLVLLHPDGQPRAEFDLIIPPPLWIPAVLRTASCSVYMTAAAHYGRDRLDLGVAYRAVKAGLAVGAQLPTHLYHHSGEPLHQWLERQR